MTAWVIGIRTLIVVVVALNGFGAGFAAALHGWQPEISRRTRLLIAGFGAGMLPLSFVVLALVMDLFSAGGANEEALYWAIFFVVVLSGLDTRVSARGFDREPAGRAAGG
jgi:hypothetical protein